MFTYYDYAASHKTNLPKKRNMEYVLTNMPLYLKYFSEDFIYERIQVYHPSCDNIPDILIYNMFLALSRSIVASFVVF